MVFFRAFFVRASHVGNTGQGGVKFGIFVHYMAKVEIAVLDGGGHDS